MQRRLESPLRVWGHVNMAVVPKNYYSRLDAAFCAASSVDLSTPKRTTYFPTLPPSLPSLALAYFSLNLQQCKKILKLRKTKKTSQQIGGKWF